MSADRTLRDKDGMKSPLHSAEERERLKAVADQHRREMENLALDVRDLVLAQPPIVLLGYLRSQLVVSMLKIEKLDKKINEYNNNIDSFQFYLEYVHAVWSCHELIDDKKINFDEKKAKLLIKTLDKMRKTTLWYCMASSAASIYSGRDRRWADIEFFAKSTWAFIRGHRYQVLEHEFFSLVLSPHAEALRAAYGMSSDEIAIGIQNISDAMRTGFSEAVENIRYWMDRSGEMVEQTGLNLKAIVERLRSEEIGFQEKMAANMSDIFYGGTCNLSRHTSLTATLLADISYAPGENKEFYAPGDFCGTPMRTLPARVKPGIKLGNEFYATDGQFVRDSAYRAIQRGVWSRAAYRDEWLKRQGALIERAFPTIFSKQLAGARTFESVYFREADTGKWVETDLVIVIFDVLIVIEAKAGIMLMHSPAMSLSTHERTIEKLVVDAYRQCKRFLTYVASAPEVALFHMKDGNYLEVARIKLRDFRVVLPIGLTIEAFTPFSAIAKELPEIETILGRFPFISMSVDDLFVLSRFLPNSGIFFHYLEVRQKIAGIRFAILFDEMDHLGAYISKNRFDILLKDQLESADLVLLNSFNHVVDGYFEGADWELKPVPSQEFPEAMSKILNALDVYRPAGWLKIDSILRNFDFEERVSIGLAISQLLPTLAQKSYRWFHVGELEPLQLWLCRAGAAPSTSEIRRQAEVGCLVSRRSNVDVLTIFYQSPSEISQIRYASYRAPTLIQTNYAELLVEAERQRGRINRKSKLKNSKPS